MSYTRKSNLKKTPRSPSKTEKKRVRISSSPSVLVFDRVSPDKTVQSNPSQSNHPVIETEIEIAEQKHRDALAQDNKYRNSAIIKDRKTHRKVTVREANARSPYEISDDSRISIPRTKTGFSAAIIRSPESAMSFDSIKPSKKPTFLSRVFNTAKSLVSKKKTAGKRTQKRYKSK